MFNFNMIKQAQDLQKKITENQKKLESMEFTGSAGNDSVKIIMTGKKEAISVQISDSVMDDRETLEDLILVALKDALEKASVESATLMKQATGNLPIPPGLF